MMSNRGKQVEETIKQKRPDLLEIFNTYDNEAKQARTLLNNNLQKLKDGDEILEIGAGILALSVQLCSEGFKVTSVEPVQDGFNEIQFIMNMYLELSRSESLNFSLLNSKIEENVFQNKFNFIFSINVMEHVKNPYLVIKQVHALLLPNARYRFICPNYDFPYEPHFKKFMFRRRNKAFYLPESRILEIQDFESQIKGLYNSLNYITIKKIDIYAKNNHIRISRNRKAFYQLIVRSLSDINLQNRHINLTAIVNFISKIRMLKVFLCFPSAYAPIIDLEILNSEETKN